MKRDDQLDALEKEYLSGEIDHDEYCVAVRKLAAERRAGPPQVRCRVVVPGLNPPDRDEDIDRFR